jgi:hypothetical protein
MPLYVDAANGRFLAGADEALAIAIAASMHLHAKPGGVELLTLYGPGVPKDIGELPLWRLAVKGPWSPRAVVSTKQGRVLRKDDELRAWTGPVFRQLHMLDFVPGTKLRDWALLVMAVAMLAIGSGGLWLAWQTRRRKAA